MAAIANTNLGNQLGYTTSMFSGLMISPLVVYSTMLYGRDLEGKLR